jgi:hypothetical protein
MKNPPNSSETPFINQISFHKLIESFKEIAKSDIDYRANYARAILNEIDKIPQFRTGIDDLSLIENNKDLIKNLLADLFPTALTDNEIKAIAIPFQDITFNYTKRFKKILDDAGVDFDMNIRNFENHLFYIMNCCLILNYHYNQKLDLNIPLFYDIPDSNGIMKHYRILYNADFIEIIATENAVTLSQNDIDILIDNFDNISLWKEKFPPNSWIMKGFGVVQLFDASTESAISNLKTNLLKEGDDKEEQLENFETIFRSIFKIPDLKIGLTLYNDDENKFYKPGNEKKKIKSLILNNLDETNCDSNLCKCFFEIIIQKKQTFTISNVEQFVTQKGNEIFGESLRQQNIKSCIFAPVVKDGVLLGVFELASEKVKELNSINATKLEMVLPYLVDTLNRFRLDIQNQIESVIQKEYTAIHPSVYWKFRKEAQKHLTYFGQSKEYILKEIVFKEVYPLFGEIDIKGSSEHRNLTVKQDLTKQIDTLIDIIQNLKSKSNLVILEQRLFELDSFKVELDQNLKADTEQLIQRYIQTEIHPIISNNSSEDNHIIIDDYFEKIDEKSGMFYHARRKFDNALSKINKQLATLLDEKQKEAQLIFPHYYERFKTDGVEHNLYIGSSIEPNKPFDKIYLNNLRLWQLQTLCEMELAHHELKASLPYNLEVTSLILVFSSPISIRFRMDEKRFDVDGTYNARYEVVKKRIDKAFIKNSKERITEKEKITIVYSHSSEEKEYLDYIKYLQFKGILESTIEKFEVEELQGVSGLRGIRVKVAHQN